MADVGMQAYGGERLPPKIGGSSPFAVPLAAGGGIQMRPSSKQMLHQGAAATPRRRPASQQPGALFNAQRAQIWMGSGTQLEEVSVPSLKQCLPKEVHENEQVIAAEQVEAAAREHEEARRYLPAAECLTQAVALREQLLGDHPGVRAAAEHACCRINYWGMQCLRAKQHATALELLKKAEAMTDAEHAPNYQRRVALRAAVFLNLCCYFRARGKLHAALRFAEKAVKIEQRYKEADGSARSRLNYAVLLSAVGRHEDAIEQIESAIAALWWQSQQSRGQPQWETNGQTNKGSLTDPGAPGSARATPVSQEEAAIIGLVVANHNLGVELDRRLATQEAAVTCLMRATNIAKQNLGPEHPLTVKVEDSLAAVKGLVNTAASRLPSPAPTTSRGGSRPEPQQLEDDLARYGVRGGAGSKTPAPRLPSITPAVPHTTAMSPVPIPARPATVAGQVADTGAGQQMTAKPSYRTAAEDALVHKLQLEDGAPGGADRAAGAARPASGAASRGEAASLSGTTPSPKPPATPRQMAPRPGRPGSGLRPATALGGEVPRPGSVLEAPQHLPPRPATVASSRRPHADGEGVAEEEGLTDEDVPMDYWMATGAPTTAAERLQGLQREHFGAMMVADAMAEDARRQQRVERLTQEPENLAPHQRFQPGVGGPGYNRRRKAYGIVHAARQVYVENVAALRIQKCWRGHRTRRNVQEAVSRIANQTATFVQSLFRRYRTVQQLDKRRRAAMTIQAGWRRCYIARQQQRWILAQQQLPRLMHGCVVRSRLWKLRYATVFFQRLIRGSNARNRLRHRHNMKTIIQKVVRGTVWRRKLWRMTRAVNTIGARWRGCLLRTDMAGKHLAATRFQTLYRGYCGRKRVAVIQAASRKIASLWRSYRVRVRMKPKSRVKSIQAWFRGLLDRERMRRWPREARRIQNAWREHQQRARFRTRVAIAIVLQKHARRHLTNFNLGNLARVTTNCQKTRRACAWRRRLAELDSRAVQLQKAWRGTAARWQVRDMQVQSCIIQRHVRGASCRWRLRRSRQAANTIRSAWLGYNIRQKTKRLRTSCLLISRIYRGANCRRRLREQHEAAKRIQRHWRRLHSLQEAKRVLEATKKIQARARAFRDRQRYKERRRAAQVIEAHWRRREQSRRLARKRRLAVALQATWRGRQGRAYLVRCEEAAACLQRAWRDHVTVRKLRQRRLAATKLQAWALGLCVRWQLRREHAAATKLQKVARGNRSRRTERRRPAANLIMAWMRGRIARLRFLRKRTKATALQKLWRGQVRRRTFKDLRHGQARIVNFIRTKKVKWAHRDRQIAATTIQRCWRRKAAWLDLKRRHAAATRIQRCLRGWSTRRRLARLQRVVIALQALARTASARRRLARMRHLQSMLCRLKRCGDAAETADAKHDAAFHLGSLGKQHLSNKRLAERQAAAVHIQRIVRGHLGRKHMRHEAVVGLQTKYRVLKAKQEVERRRAEVDQQTERSLRLKQQDQERRRVAAATRIQAFVRARQAWTRRCRCDVAATNIQRVCRGIAVRRAHKTKVQATVRLQAATRTFLTPRLKAMHRAACTIQHAYLQYRLRTAPECHDYFTAVEAATKIQASWRRHCSRAQYLRSRKAATYIEATVRMHRAYLKRKQAVAAATLIQAKIARPAYSRYQADFRRRHAVKVQSFARMVVAKRRARIRRAAVLKIQSEWRAMLGRHRVWKIRQRAATKIQAQVRRWFYSPGGPIPAAQRRRVAAVRIQAMVRGVLLRRRLVRREAAALVIQRRARLRFFRKRLYKKRWLILTLQRIWRARHVRHRTDRAHGKLAKVPGICRGVTWRSNTRPDRKAAAVTIQRVARGRAGRRLVAKQRAAVTRLQAWFRRYLQLRKYWKMRRAMESLELLVQRIRRRKQIHHNKSRHVVRRVFHTWLPIARRRRKRECCIRIQRHQRGFRSRCRLNRALDAAEKIQGLLTAVNAREGLRQRMAAACKIQAAWRRHREQERYHRTRYLLVFLQAQIRGWLVRRHLHAKRQAAVHIQRIFRGFRTRRSWSRKDAASHVIGKDLRSFLVVLRLRRQRAAARKIQSAWRLHLARNRARQERDAATQIQAAWRLRLLTRRYGRARAAAATITGGGQMFVEMRLKRRKVAAATRIAAAWRGYLLRLELYHKTRAINKIKRWWMRARDAHIALSRAMAVVYLDYVEKHVMVIQRCVRRWFCRRHAFLDVHHGATRWLGRRHGIVAVRYGITRLQARYRSWSAKLYVKLLRRLKGLNVTSFLSENHALLPDKQNRLTRCRPIRVRNKMVARTVRVVRLQAMPPRLQDELARPVERIQAYFRFKRLLGRVVKAYAFARGYLVRRELRKARQAFMARRHWVRANISFKKFRHSVVWIQSHVRGVLVRKKRQRLREELAIEAGEKASDSEEEVAPTRGPSMADVAMAARTVQTPSPPPSEEEEP